MVFSNPTHPHIAIIGSTSPFLVRCLIDAHESITLVPEPRPTYSLELPALVDAFTNIDAALLFDASMKRARVRADFAALLDRLYPPVLHVPRIQARTGHRFPRRTIHQYRWRAGRFRHNPRLLR